MIDASQLHQATVRHFASLAHRCHVGQSPLQVARYAVSRMRKGAWRGKLTRDARKTLLRALFAERLENRALYRFVMGGH